MTSSEVFPTPTPTSAKLQHSWGGALLKTRMKQLSHWPVDHLCHILSHLHGYFLFLGSTKSRAKNPAWENFTPAGRRAKDSAD